MKLENLQFGIKCVSIGVRLLTMACVGTIVAGMGAFGQAKFLAVLLILLLLSAIAGGLAVILGTVNLRKVNWNYRLAFWAMLAVIVLGFKIGGLGGIREIFQYGMTVVVILNLIQGTNELLEQRDCAELIRWGRWVARWTVAVAAVSFLYVFFRDVVNSAELQTICLIAGTILSILFLIYYIGFLGDAGKEISTWESMPEKNAPQQTDQV